MTVLSHAQVLGYALAAGFDRPAANMITVISHYESGDNPKNIGDLTLSKYGSRGLTQDFTGAHSPTEILGHGGTSTRDWTPALVAELEDPLKNMKAARIIYRAQGLKAWSTYNNLHATSAWGALLAAVAKMTPVMPGTPSPTLPAPPVKLKGTMTPVQRAQHESLHPTRSYHDQCLVFVRTCFGLAADGHEPTAYSAWVEAGGAAGPNTHTVRPAPANVPIFLKGSGAAGHIMLSAGHGMAWSTDIARSGKVDLTSIKHVESAWGMRYLGWAEMLEGKRIIAHVA